MSADGCRETPSPEADGAGIRRDVEGGGADRSDRWNPAEGGGVGMAFDARWASWRVLAGHQVTGRSLLEANHARRS
jgi:hypothetical protein